MRRVFRISLLTGLVSVAAGCGSGPKPAAVPVTDRALAQNASAARSAFDLGRYEQAVKLYGLARDHARMADDPRAIGNMSYNLAMSLIAMGRHEEALTALDEAESEIGRAGGGLADVRLVQAEALGALGRPEEAAARAGRVLADRHVQTGPLHRAGAALILGRLACERGDPAEAERHLAAARAAAGGDANAIAAAAAGLEGRIRMIRSLPGEAAVWFDCQADLLRGGRQFSAMADALALAGRAYSDAGRPADAADRQYRAARARLGQDRLPAAAELIGAAVRSAEKAGDPDLIRKVGALEAEIKRRGGNELNH